MLEYYFIDWMFDFVRLLSEVRSWCWLKLWGELNLKSLQFPLTFFWCPIKMFIDYWGGSLIRLTDSHAKVHIVVHWHFLPYHKAVGAWKGGQRLTLKDTRWFVLETLLLFHYYRHSPHLSLARVINS